MSDFQVNINDIVTLVSAVEIAINKKVYSKEQVDKLFPIWNEVTARLQKIQRQKTIEHLYSQESKPVAKTTDNVTKDVPESNEPTEEDQIDITKSD